MVLFQFRAILLSCAVALRTAPILFVAAAFFYALSLIENDYVFYGVAGAGVIPILGITVLSGLRGGLMQIGATTAPHLGRLVRASVVGMAIFLGLTALALAIAALPVVGFWIMLGPPDTLALLRDMVLFQEGSFDAVLARLMLNVPVTLGGAWIIGTGAYAALAVPIAAMAANVAERSPRHDVSYGAFRQGKVLALLSFLTILLPGTQLWPALADEIPALFATLGQIREGSYMRAFDEGLPTLFAQLKALDQEALLALLHVLWVPFLLWAGAAVAYVRTGHDLVVEQAEDDLALLGPEYRATDLKSLRRNRNAAASMNNAVYSIDT
ncbi:MAG: hypothetical protein AAGE18_04730 [Pseudomonadota bacterium]